MILCDFHIHSSFSDGSLTIPELVDFYGSRGFGCIAITDHLCEQESFIGKVARHLEKTLTPETWDEYLATIDREADRAWRQYKMLVLPGYELTKNSVSNSRSAHLLGIGSRKYIAADADVVSLATQIRDSGGLVVGAHPVHTRRLEKQTFHLWDRRHELAPLIDAWEVASGPYLFSEVQETKLPKLASSDLHRPSQIRSWKTIVHAEPTEEAILDAVRRQRIDFKFFDCDDFSVASPRRPAPRPRLVMAV